MWVSRKLTGWLIEASPNMDWPFPNPDRISGPRWARTSVRPDGHPRYTALVKLEEFGGRAYRIEDRNGNVNWCSGEICHPPLTDLERMNGVPEQNVENRYRCQSCGAMRCCTATTGTGHHLCRHCIGVQFEKNERPSLRWCKYEECKNCTDHFESNDKFVAFVNALNRPVGRVVR